MNHEFDSRAPVIKTESVQLCRRVDVRGLETYEYVGFVQDIVWIRSCTARCIIGTVGGPELKGGSTYSDYRGYLGCIDDALADALLQIEPYGIGPTSKLQVRVVVEVTEVPVVRSSREPFYKGAGYNRWIEAPHDWRVGLSDEVEAWDRKLLKGEYDPATSPVLHRKTVVNDDIWSSAMLDQTVTTQLDHAMKTLEPAFVGYASNDDHHPSRGRLAELLGRVLASGLPAVA